MKNTPIPKIKEETKLENHHLHVPTHKSINKEKLNFATCFYDSD